MFNCSFSLYLLCRVHNSVSVLLALHCSSAKKRCDDGISYYKPTLLLLLVTPTVTNHKMDELEL